MNESTGKYGQTWALVLAAGSGARLGSLTTTSAGVAVPKQFCSLRGGSSLLHEALVRAEAVATRERICTIVAQEHAQWWAGQTLGLPSENVIVQPQNRGTAIGIMLPLLHILMRDPNANLVLLPSDQHVDEEETLSGALRGALASLEQRQYEILLLGIGPEEVDPELGYIVPGEPDGQGGYHIDAFVEKPSRQVAEQLIAAGALCNAFIVVARARALFELFALRALPLLMEMSAAVAHDARQPNNPVAAARLYPSLPEMDFSRHIVAGYEHAFRVINVPPCGWTDLGTPRRVVQTLRCGSKRAPVHPTSKNFYGSLSLAEQVAALESRC